MNNLYNPYLANYGYGYNYNQMAQQQSQQPIQRTTEPQYYQQNQYIQQYKPPILQGKIVEGIDVVKSIDIPLDGSVSYFPTADSSAIITKQLQTDGTSKTIIYKPTNEEEKEGTKEIKYLTIEDLEKSIKKLNTNDIREEIQIIKEQMEFLLDDIKDLKDITSNANKNKERSSK